MAMAPSVVSAITLKTKEEIAIIRGCGAHLARVMRELVRLVAPDVSAGVLEARAEDLIDESGGRSSFKGYRVKEVKQPYPAAICVSINDEIVHGIPHQEKIFRAGDVVSIDAGLQWPKDNGLFTDMAVTVPVGRVSPDRERLLAVTKSALDVAIAMMRPGVRLGDLGHAIEQHLRSGELGVVQDLAGHGVGYAVHEPPLIPNFGHPGEGAILQEGIVIAVEPMATLGKGAILLASDGWTVRTADNSVAAHFEHTIAITADGAEVLTKAEDIF